MVKIVRIIGGAMFLLTVSSNVWAGVATPTSTPTPTPKSTVVPTVAVPRNNYSPRRADYYYHDDYHARHLSAPAATPTVTAPPSNAHLNFTVYQKMNSTVYQNWRKQEQNAYPNSTIAYQNWRKQEMGTGWVYLKANTPQPRPALKVMYFQYPTPRPFTGSAASYLIVTGNQAPAPTATPTATPTPTPTQAPASNRAIPK